MSLPADLSFQFEATSKNGKITTSFKEDLNKNRKKQVETIGEAPENLMKIVTNDGDIKVSK